MHEGTFHFYSQPDSPAKYDRESEKFWEKFPRRVFTEFTSQVRHRGMTLDLGSGTGRGAVLLKVFGNEVVCLDRSPEMVNFTQHRLGIPSIKGDFENIPFGDETFSGVWASRSLFGIPRENLSDSIKEIRRVLIPHGVFGVVMVEPTKKKTGNAISEIDGKARMVARYLPQEMETILRDHGLNVYDYDKIRTRSKFFVMLARKAK